MALLDQAGTGRVDVREFEKVNIHVFLYIFNTRPFSYIILYNYDILDFWSFGV